MAYKEREFTCEICGKKFRSRQRNPKSCSKSCKMKLMGKQLKSEKIKIGKCEWCKKDFEYVPNSRRPVRRFCSQECRHKNLVNDIKKNGLSDETKKKISKKLSGVTLHERGFTDEAIQNSINALKEAGRKWNDSIKGKTYEEIYGEEKARKLKEEFSNNRIGEKNSQSLENIAKRNKCTLKEASKYTSCYGRVKNLHPMYNRNHKIETKKKIIKSLELKGVSSYNIAVGVFNNIVWQGSWELQFLIECYNRNILVKRYDLDPIEYWIDKKKRHYFPDYIINNSIIVEIKNPTQLTQTVVKKKKEAAEKIFGDSYIIISDGFINNTSRKLWYKQMKEKYGDILIITHNPHEDEKWEK